MSPTVIEVGKDTDLIRLDIARLDAGETESFARDDEEICIVVLSGVVDVVAGDQAPGRAGGGGAGLPAPRPARDSPPRRRPPPAPPGGAGGGGRLHAAPGG